MKKILLFAVMLLQMQFVFAQFTDTINEHESRRIISYLASDSLKGRGNITTDLVTAAKFIGAEFSKAGLQVWPGAISYHVPFHPWGGDGRIVMDELFSKRKKIPPDQFLYLHPVPGDYPEKVLSDFKLVKIETAFTNDILEDFVTDTAALLLLTDKMQPDGKKFLPDSIKIPVGGLKHDRLLLSTTRSLPDLSLTSFPSQYLTTEYNVVGVLPGHSKPDEIVMFSAHYDHVGLFGHKGDTILNGANDDASGTTALILLAKYFAMKNDNARTILFCAFAGEEDGLLGSKDFAEHIDSSKIVAGINIEMIGIPQYGKNKLVIIGRKYSNLPRTLEKGLKQKGISTVVEPSEKKQLFQRSDNYSFALKGIPYHTLMASDDDDRCYHKPCDEVKRIDIANMTRIIKGIAAAVAPLVNGDATPRRINPKDVKLKDE